MSEWLWSITKLILAMPTYTDEPYHAIASTEVGDSTAIGGELIRDQLLPKTVIEICRKSIVETAKKRYLEFVPPAPAYVPRLADALIDDLFAAVPAVLLVGPRAAGKTTTARRHARTVIRLDRPAEAAAFAADPDVALADLDEPVLLDEWQEVPAVLGAVKRAVDDDPRPGRFLLTGSVRAELNAPGWPGTGRLVRVPLWGLAERELVSRARTSSVIDLLFEAAFDEIRVPRDPPNLRDYCELALRGGFPQVATQSSSAIRRRWLDAYLEQLIQRDAAAVGAIRDPRLLRRYVRAIAANSAGVGDHKTLYDAAGINRVTAISYDGLLEALFVVDRVPAWTHNRLARVARAPKRYLVEPAFLGPLLGLDVRAVMRDVDQLGRLVDTFTLAQLRAELEPSRIRPTVHHLRLEHGRREVDLVLEASDGRVVAIEVKASAAPDREMARHLLWLRDELGPDFVAGVVLHTGPRSFQIDERIHALPICAIWSPRGS